MLSALEPLRLEQLDAGLRTMLQPTFDRLGYVNEFFLVAGRVPAALRAFADFTEALKKQLPMNINEVISLTVSTRLGCETERIQHERLVLKQGLAREWIAELTHKGPTPAESFLSAEEQTARAVAIAMLSADQAKIAKELTRAIDVFGADSAVAVAMQVARCVMISMWFNAFEIKVPVTSIFSAG